jgi:hypothetical protein
MTERDLGNSISWWIGEVVNVKDPDQSGRVQIRVYGRHDDTGNIPDSDLPWALPLQPVTSAAYGKIGTTPLGLVRGSKVMGFWMDSDQQYPVIWGSFGKAGDELPGIKNGTQKIDTKKGSIPGPAQNYSDPVPINPYSTLWPTRIDINKINNEKAVTFKTIDQYLPSSGIVNNTKVDSKLKEPEKPTTASVKKDKKDDILDLVKQVDPDKISRSLKGMVDGFTSVRNVMSLTSPAGLTSMLSGGLQGMIQGMAGQLGLGPAMGLMNGLAASGALSGIAQGALQQAIASTALSAVQNGGIPLVNSLVSNVVPQINLDIGHPSAALIVADVVATAVQQYFPIDKEPFPGYIQFKDIATDAIYYKLRGNEPHYESAQAHIQANASAKMLSEMSKLTGSGALDNVISKAAAVTNITGAATEIAGALGATGVADALGAVNNIAGNVTGAVANFAGGNLLGSVPLAADVASQLGGIISGGLGSVASQGIASVLGNGVNLGSITSLASKLLPGGLAGAIGGIMNGHLPTSVLDVKKVGAAMGDFTKNQALMQVKKKQMKKAIDPDKAGDDLSKLSDAQKAAKLSVTGASGLDGDFTGVATAAPDLATTIIQNNPGGTGNAATDVGSPFG